MRLLFLVIYLCTSTYLHCSPIPESLTSIPLADTETEASAIVGGCINVITGSYIARHQDWSLPSSEPLSLTRSYAQKRNFPYGLHLCWRHSYQSEARCTTSSTTRSGTKEYHADVEFVASSGSASSYHHHSKTKEDTFPMSFALIPSNYFGLTNAGSGVINGQSNHKNNVCELQKKIKTKPVTEGSLKIKTGSGHCYLMQQDEHTTPPRENPQHIGEDYFHYRLQEERKPNGNKISYKYDDEGNLIEVSSKNAAGNLSFGSFTFKHANRKELNDNPFLDISGNDGRKIEYQFTSKKFKHAKPEKQFYVASVKRPDGPDEFYDYVNSKHYYFCLLSGIRDAKGGFLKINYHTSDDSHLTDKVASLEAPVGPGGKSAIIYSFTYTPMNKKKKSETIVTDASQQSTVYKINSECQLEAIKRSGKNGRYNQEHFYWGVPNSPNWGNLLSHTMEDSGKNIFSCRSYKYDSKGNPIEEQFWGNLTGKNHSPIILKDGYPENNGAECYKVVKEYSQDGFNLLLKEIEPNGKQTEYRYKPNSNLLVAKFTRAGDLHVREFFEYDENTATLTLKIQDDGKGKESWDLSGVTERLITAIIPNLVGGGIGLPKEIKERYLDLSTKSEVLLKREILNYDKYGNLTQQDTYDSEGQSLFSTYWQYDAKGRVVEEANSEGQVISNRYDVNGNCIYTKGPNPNVETHNIYDLANRLIATEEHHPNKLKLSQKFTYDELGRQLTSTDIYGNVTQHIYDEFGRCIRTIQNIFCIRKTSKPRILDL
ncbi:MAG: RHS repeat protein [Parachlamydiaceae bacterium]|nr:RHS repeat protein [Parachlamydiaceae bacterium]